MKERSAIDGLPFCKRINPPNLPPPLSSSNLIDLAQTSTIKIPGYLFRSIDVTHVRNVLSRFVSLCETVIRRDSHRLCEIGVLDGDPAPTLRHSAAVQGWRGILGRSSAGGHVGRRHFGFPANPGSCAGTHARPRKKIIKIEGFETSER